MGLESLDISILHIQAGGAHILAIGVLQGLAAGTLLYITFYEVFLKIFVMTIFYEVYEVFVLKIFIMPPSLALKSLFRAHVKTKHHVTCKSSFAK